MRKWFVGESVPRSKKLTALAKLLEVDEGWLVLGIELPKEYEGVRCMGFVPGDGMRFRVLDFGVEDTKKYLQRRGSAYALKVEREGNVFRSGGTCWPIITDMRDLK